MNAVEGIALVAALGVSSQWLAWRLRLPAIVVMLVAGLAAGPVTGLLDPAVVFGELLQPLIAISVALILFEGGITLRLSALRDASASVRRLVFPGAPLGWVASALAAHYGAGLSWEASAIFGGILIVTGPTVVTPLLRHARLGLRVSETLRWEAIVNDPLGALAAVLAFEVVQVLHTAAGATGAMLHLLTGIATALAVGLGFGWMIVRSFRRGHVPEYMKIPVLLGAVVVGYALSDGILHESGLLTVTVMGAVIGNSPLPSLAELRRFKEHVTVLLVSGVFIILAAGLSWDMIALLNWRAALFVALILFVARPLAVSLSLLGTGGGWPEKALVAWVGPRGVVAVAVSGLFGARLVENGVADGALLAPLAFAVVAVTVIVHGFSLRPVARWLGLTSKEPPGVIILGGAGWTADLADALNRGGVPVAVSDRNWFRLRQARHLEIPVLFGEILSEATEHRLEMQRYDMIWALSDNDDYNTLVCTNFAPELGHDNVYQVGRHEHSQLARDLPETIGGRQLGSGLTFEELQRRAGKGWQFDMFDLDEEIGLAAFAEENPKAERVALVRGDGRIAVFKQDYEPKVQSGDRLLAMVPPEPPTASAQ